MLRFDSSTDSVTASESGDISATSQAGDTQTPNSEASEQQSTHGAEDAVSGGASPTYSTSYTAARDRLRDDHNVELYAVAAAQAAEAILQRQAREAEMKEKRKEARIREDALRKTVAAWRKLLDKERLHRDPKTVRSLAAAGVPSQLRGRVWTTLIGNTLQVTPELFTIFKQHAATNRALVQRERDLLLREMKANRAEAAAGEQAAPTVEASAADEAASPLTSPAAASSPPLGDAPAAALHGKEGTLGLIQLDIPRTFPELAFFAEGGPLHEPLRDVLEAYTCFRPDVGYVQGMSFLAAMLLLNMGPEEAFAGFANLLANNVYFDFYRLDMARMDTHIAAYEALFAQELPRLFRHFQDEGVQPNQYIVSWLLTLFTRALPLDVACRVWDVYLAGAKEDELILWRVALALLTVLQPRLLQEDIGGILKLLNAVPDEVTGDVLLGAMQRISLSKRGFDALLARVRSSFQNKPSALQGAAAGSGGSDTAPARAEADAEGGWLQAPAFTAAHASLSPQPHGAALPQSPPAFDAAHVSASGPDGRLRVTVAAEGEDEASEVEGGGSGGGLLGWMKKRMTTPK